MDIKPIETYYNGYRFRSRLEARWAVFFDALGVKYEYEPEGFDLGDGLYYLPDFKIKCWGTRGEINDKPFDLWIEVKGIATREDCIKVSKFSGGWEIDDKGGVGWMYVSKNPTIVLSNIPKNTHSISDEVWDYKYLSPFNYCYIDGDYFLAYPTVKNGKFYLMGDDSNYMSKEGIRIADYAYTKARQARFEHGETPIIKRQEDIYYGN